MIAIMVKLQCITNMHVGNGDVNYNIIDNEVEKDPVTGYPTINSSGVKGALREYFSSVEALKGKVNEMFGGDERNSRAMPGRLKFFGADMLAMPARATKGDAAYYMITTQTAINKWKENCKIFLNKECDLENPEPVGRAVEGIELKKASTLADMSNKQEVHVVSDDEFKFVSLPVMARNKLDNGKSDNLWYEEIVPHESVFTFVVCANDGDKDLLMDFKKSVENQVIQFGGNASIGYGFCNVAVMGERYE